MTAILAFLRAFVAFYTPAPCMDTTHAPVPPVAAPVACGWAVCGGYAGHGKPREYQSIVIRSRWDISHSMHTI